MTLNLNLNLPKGLSLPSTLQHLLLVVHGEELTLSCMKNSAGKFFITGGGTFHHNLRIANVYEANAESTIRFSHTYFQNCVREWNQLDESIKSSSAASVFKRELMRLIRPPKQITVWLPRPRGSTTINPFTSRT